MEDLLQNIQGVFPINGDLFHGKVVWAVSSHGAGHQRVGFSFAGVQFVKIDIDELMAVAKEFEVQVVPTFILLKQGKEVDKVAGTKKDELHNKIQMHKGLKLQYA